MSPSGGGPAVFPFGSAMLRWVRQGGRTELAGPLHRFLISWQSFWAERNLALQRRLPVPAFPDSDPVFILGLWRSGTTLLHNLLAAPPGMIYPATWQCMNPSSFRLRSPPRAGNAVVRPMDGFSIDALSPQEDEFALLALGVPSVYRGFFDPRRLSELARWLEFDAWDRDRPPGWLDLWREFLAGVANGSPGRLILKSPNHTFRIRALKVAFPDARYVWVVRDPEDVFFSNRKMWIAMFRRYALWNWNLSELDSFLQRAFESASNCLSYATGVLPTDRLALVDFSELTSNPVATADAINCRLGLSDRANGRSAFEEVAAATSAVRADSYEQQVLPPFAAASLERLRLVQRAALESHGM